MDLRHLDLILTIAEAGSISRAARAVGVSQPALSAQLNRIERKLDGPVFDRTPGGVEATPLGRLLVDRARRIRSELDGLSEEIGRLRSTDRPLRLAANYEASFFALMSYLVERGHGRDVIPHIDISTTALTRALVAGDVDMGVVGVHPGFDDVPGQGVEQMTVVETEPFLVVLSAHDPLARRGSEIALTELGAHRWLTPSGEPDGTDMALRRAHLDAGIIPEMVVAAGPVATCWPMIAAGEAVSVTLPTIMPPTDAGVAVLPLQGMPIYGRLVVRWVPGRATAEEAMLVGQAAQVAFQQQLSSSAMLQPWWNDIPLHRPVVNDLALTRARG